MWFGIVAGMAWNATSLWCLSKLLHAWLGPQPSRRRVLLWLAVKFPLLYGGVWVLLRTPEISMVGFGIGFSLVLVGAMVWLVRRAPQASPAGAPRMMMAPSHGR